MRKVSSLQEKLVLHNAVMLTLFEWPMQDQGPSVSADELGRRSDRGSTFYSFPAKRDMQCYKKVASGLYSFDWSTGRELAK